jgi:hypothetical protein
MNENISVLIKQKASTCCTNHVTDENPAMSDKTFEDNRKPAAVEEKEPRGLEKGESGSVKLPPSSGQSRNTRSSSSHHKRSHKDSQKHKHYHCNKSSRVAHPSGDIDDEKIAANDHLRAPHATMAPYYQDELVSSAEDTKPRYKSSQTAHCSEEADDVSIAKPRESLMYTSSLVARGTATVRDAEVQNGKTVH